MTHDSDDHDWSQRLSLHAPDSSFDEHNLPENFKKFTRLRELNFSNNNFSCIPSEITRLKTLRFLALTGNRLTVLPPEIRNWQVLRYLGLANNKLRDLPPEIGQLLNLQHLDVSSNEIQNLPSAISGMINLVRLSVDNNPMQTFPYTMSYLSLLEEVNVENTPLVSSYTPAEFHNVLSLQEIVGRFIVRSQIPYSDRSLSLQLCDFLNRAKPCERPYCHGCYLDTFVARITFVNRWGVTKLPLLQRLCSPFWFRPQE